MTNVNFKWSAKRFSYLVWKIHQTLLQSTMTHVQDHESMNQHPLRGSLSITTSKASKWMTAFMYIDLQEEVLFKNGGWIMCVSHHYKSMCGQESIDVNRSHSSNTAMLIKYWPWAQYQMQYLFIQEKKVSTSCISPCTAPNVTRAEEH